MTAALELVSASGSVRDLVARLAGADTLAMLAAFAGALESTDDGSLQATRARLASLDALLREQLVEDDEPDEVELAARLEALRNARAHVWRLHLATSREVGRRLEAAPASGPGRPRAPGRAALRRRFGVTAHLGDQLVALAQLDERAYQDCVRAALDVVRTKGRPPAIGALVRAGASPTGEAPGNEWSTPPAVMDAIRSALGGRIALDVASHLAAQVCSVRADRWLGAAAPQIDSRCEAWAEVFGLPLTSGAWSVGLRAFAGVDALATDWASILRSAGGRPTLHGNPPYSGPLVAAFADRLEAVTREVPDLAWCWLVNADSTASWQQRIGALGPHCQVARRIAFLGVDGRPTSGNRAAQIVFGGGGGLDVDAWHAAISVLGRCYLPITDFSPAE